MDQQNSVTELAMPAMDTLAQFRRRSHADNVQDIWRKHGWVPPTESRKDFRASLRTTAYWIPLHN
jgi:hypothetical protein